MSIYFCILVILWTARLGLGRLTEGHYVVVALVVGLLVEYGEVPSLRSNRMRVKSAAVSFLEYS